MCGRYTSTSSIEQLVEIYDVDDVRTEALVPRWNVAPSQPVYAIADRRASSSDGAARCRQLGPFRWGLVPSWAKDPAVGNRMINARADSLAQRPAFRAAFARRRCLIPADAFYEWQVPAPPLGASAGGPAGKRGRVPWAVRLRDGQPMAFAGLWEVWREESEEREGGLVRSCAIITTEANELLAPIHSRMPVVLAPSTWDQWLDPTTEDPDLLQGLLVPAPPSWFDAFIVSSRVNSVVNEGPELLDPAPPPDRATTAQAPLFD